MSGVSDSVTIINAINSFPLNISFSVAPDINGINELITHLDFMEGAVPRNNDVIQ